MGRRPIEENKNEFDIRQSMWNEILKGKPVKLSDFKYYEGDKTTKRQYLKSLCKADFIMQIGKDEYESPIYQLSIKNPIKCAPQLNKDGIAVFEGKVNQRMWQVMKIQKTFTSKELAEFSGTTLYTARAYLKHLNKAGYVKYTRKGKKAIYQFLDVRNSGYFAPMIKRTKEVFDPNLQVVMGKEEVSYVLD